MHRPVKKRDFGMALIIVTVLLALIVGIVLGVVALNQSGAKHAAFFKDREIALTLAKAGVADALYRMNYKLYGANDYPFGSDGSSFSESEPFDDPSTSYGGSYSVTLTDGGENLDEIAAAGTYNGKTRTISVKIRGNNTLGNDLNDADHGIAEAFNKHAIYADTVSYSSGTVDGNICTTSSSATVTGSNTWTQISSDDPPTLTEPTYTYTYTDNDDAVVDAGEGDSTPATGPSATYTAAPTDSYEFTGVSDISSNSEVNGDVILSGSSQVSAFLKGEAISITSTTVTVDSAATLYTTGSFNCAVAATINGIICANTITLSNCTVNNLVYATGNINLTNVTIDEAIVCGGTLTINSGTIDYDEDPTAFETTSIPLFANFSGGRRIYLPVLGSWEEE